MTGIIYQETWHPPALAVLNIVLPCFWNYGVIIEDSKEVTNDEQKQDEKGEKETTSSNTNKNFSRTITFGYGLRGPGGLTAKTCNVQDIDKSSITTGTANGWENLKTFGGWGIRLSLPGMGGSDLRTKKKISCTAYNGANGPYLEFIERKEGHGAKKYRFVTKEAETVSSLLRLDD
jgi:hypothetical protein